MSRAAVRGGALRATFPLSFPEPHAVTPSRAAALLVLAALVLSAAAAEGARIRRDGAQLRAEVGFTGPVLASPAAGESVELLEPRNEWRLVRTRAGVEGWVHELFLDEGGVRRASSPPARPAPAPAPGGELRAEAFEAPPVEERSQTAPAAEIERLQAALVEERGLRREAERHLEELERELAAARSRDSQRLSREQDRLQELEAENLRLTRELSEARAALGEAAEAVGGAEDAAARALARLAERHDEEIAALEREHEETLAAERRTHAAQLEEARAAKAEEIAGLQRRLREEQDRIGERFVEDCAALHERELERARSNLAADCERRLELAEAEHAVELRKVAKESGWEDEFEREVRRAVREQVDERLAEAKLRWEARRRGEAFDKERALEEQREELEQACEARVLSAVNAGLEEQRREARGRLAAVQAEEERRCRTALELVLRRVAEGASAEELRGGGAP